MEIRTLRPDDLEQAWQLDRDAFHQPAERRERFLREKDPERFAGAFDAGRLVAMSGVLPFRQYFGGRAVPMGGLASVAVAPDWRGRGLAQRVIRACVDAMAERGECLSTLFPATTRLYRGLDWEVAGGLVYRAIAPRALQRLRAPASGRVRPGGAADLDGVRACYARFARQANGCVDRPDERWQRWCESWDARSVFVAEDDAGQLAGYLVYSQLDGTHSGFGGPFRLSVEELVAPDADAALALWRLLGSWASQVERIHYRAPAEDPLLLLLPEQEIQPLAEIRWMTRVVDAAAAVEARGFAPGLEVEVPLALRDPLVAANDGRFVLRVAKRRGWLEPGGSGAVALDVGAFASLYTGWATPAALAHAGRLSGGTPDERAALGAAFAGPTPIILDEF